MNSSLPSLDQMTDILDIKPIIKVSLLWFWFLLLCLLVILGIWLYYFLKNRGRPQEKAKPEPLLSPRDVALRDLEELDHLGILERGQYRKYYFRLSEIVRLFLQDEMRLPAVDTTTEEINPYLIQTPFLNDDEKKLVSQVLVDMDLVKFARFVPSASEVQELRRKIIHFIQTAHLPKPSVVNSVSISDEQEIAKGGVNVSS